jgi:hypothetical protein
MGLPKSSRDFAAHTTSFLLGSFLWFNLADGFLTPCPTAIRTRRRAQRRSRSAVARTSPQTQALPGRTLTAPSTTADLGDWAGEPSGVCVYRVPGRITISRGARRQQQHSFAATTLYSVGASGPNHDALVRISSETPRRRTHSAQRHDSHGLRGTPPPRTVIGAPSLRSGSSRNCQMISELEELVVFVRPSAWRHPPAQRPS